MNILFGASGLTRVLVAVAVAFVPAVIVFVRGRQVARFADDPALPERLFARRRVGTQTLAFTMVMLVALTGNAAVWAIPLTIVAYFAAAFPLRRLLYRETWSLGAYLSFTIRFLVANWSFWTLVCALPGLALWAGERAWIVAVAAGAGLWLLAMRQTAVIRWMLHARPIEDAAIRARFDRLVSASGVASPYLEVIDVNGGVIANAFALPSIRRSAVLITGPLLDRLDAEETEAICAHELAHIEHETPRRLRRRRSISLTLIVAGALLTPVLLRLAPSLAWMGAAVWPVLVIVAMAQMARDRQKNETASDLRAVALTGNAEALVRALVKIHAIARVPRRWDVELERHMSHPSLKRRIQDIRGAAGTPPAALGDTAVFESADGASRAIFGGETLEWIEGTSASYRLAYDRLSELRVVATGARTTSLAAADRSGHRWRMPLRVDDVARLQAVLDIVEARVATPPARATTVQPAVIRAVALVVCIVMLNAGVFAAGIVVALTLTRPDVPLLGAAGFAAAAAAVLTWRDPGFGFGLVSNGLATGFAAALLVAAAVLLGLAYSRRRDEVSPRGWTLVGVLALAAVASWLVPLMGGGLDALGLHQAARQWPSSVVLPLALTGALAWSARKTLRVAAGVAAIAGVMAAIVGSQAFLDRFGGDLFLVPARDLTVRTLDRPVTEFTVPFGVSGLQLSPNGRAVAVTALLRGTHTAIHIGRPGAPLTPVDGDGALFIDDERALVWATDGSRTDLREVRVTAPQDVLWHVQVTGLSMPVVSLDAKTSRWRLSNRTGSGVVEGREGIIGSDRIDEYRWPLPAAHGTPVMPIAVSGDRALAIEPRFDLASSVGDPLSMMFFVFASGPRWRSTIWGLGPDGPVDLGTSRLELECHLLSLEPRGACQMFDASRTRFFTMDAGTRGITAVAALPGRFFAGDASQGSWLTGWYRSGPVAVRLAPADAIRVAGPDGAPAFLLAVSDRAAAGVWYEQAPAGAMRIDPIGQGVMTSTIRLYSID